jgi:hypothetical protein
MSGQVGFLTQRSRLLEAYKAAGQAVTCRTIPYHSTTYFQADIVNYAGAAPGVGYAVFRKNQSRTLFNYGVGNQVALGGLGGQSTATEADTNLGKASSTNGAEDFVIEGVGFHQRGVRCAYAPGTGNLYVGTGVPTDADVVASLNGDIPTYDPAAINVPPQVQSPFNLENGILNALLPLISVSFLFDRKRTEKIGTVDVMPCTSAKSYLRANGEPSQNNMYRIPEGYLWRRDGQPDSEFTAQLNLERPLVVPLNGIIPYVTGSGQLPSAAPTQIWLEVTMRLFGLAVDLPSAN